MIHNLNSLGLTNVYDFTCNTDQPCAISLNPKGFDSPRAIGFRQDRPSQTAGVNETNVYTKPTLINYQAGSPYNSRTARQGEYGRWTTFPTQDYGRNINQRYNINNAQIQYYIDESTKPPFFSPAFDMPSRAELVDYVDPMGTWKPHYKYTLLSPEKYSCLSFLNDTGFQREDIMALQQSVHNQQRSEPFFNF